MNYNYEEKRVEISRREFLGFLGIGVAALWTGLYTVTDIFVDRNKYIKMRAKGIYKDDEKQEIRQSHNNKSVQKFYKDMNMKPLGELPEEIFHTKYVDRSKLA